MLSSARRLATVSLVSLGLAACASPDGAGPARSTARPALAAGDAADAAAEVDDAEPAAGPGLLGLRRVRPDGSSLPVRAEVWDERLEERVAYLEGEPPEPVRLEPGRYRLMILERPGPFGCAVELEEGPVEVLVCSDPPARSHAMIVETRREPLGDGVTMVERQILGFGWGPPPPLPALPGETDAGLVEEASRARRARRAREAATEALEGASRRGQAGSVQTSLDGRRGKAGVAP